MLVLHESGVNLPVNTPQNEFLVGRLQNALVNAGPTYALGVGILLNGVIYANNSIVTRTDIGTDSAALLCTTTYSLCCSSGNPGTQWFFPNGTQVQNNPGLPYYRTRSTNPRAVRLHRNPQGTTTGLFQCDVFDSSGVLQRTFVGIYDSGTGEPYRTQCCTLHKSTHYPTAW